jgi:hypothetical protein
MSSIDILQPILVADPATGAITGFHNAKNQFQALTSVPTGGTAGQALTKNSSVDGDASWSNVAGVTFPAAVGYVTAVPLDGIKRMAAQTITVATSFTVAPGSVNDAECYCTLTPDGIHTPDFSPFINAGPIPWTRDHVNDVCWYKTPAGAFYFIILGATVAVVPDQVTGLANGTPGATSMPLSCSVPAGVPTDYVWQFKKHVDSTWTTFADGTSSTPSTTITGLLSGTSYDFQAAAANAVGTGLFSSVLTVTTGGISTLIADDFQNRGAASPVAPLGTRSDGGAWTQVSGTMGVQDVAGVHTARWLSGSTSAQAVASAGVSDYTVQVDMPPGFNAFNRLVARHTNATNQIELFVAHFSGYVELRKLVAGSYTTLASQSGVHDNTLTMHTAKLVCSGSSISAYYNGVLIGGAAVTETFNQTAQSVGFESEGDSTAGVFDNFLCTT